MTETTYVLLAERRALRKPEQGPALKDGNLNNWVKDDDGFQRRWAPGKRPELHGKRGRVYKDLAVQACAFNEAQLRSGFLDWLWSVDVDRPIHPCTPDCKTQRKDDA